MWGDAVVNVGYLGDFCKMRLEVSAYRKELWKKELLVTLEGHLV